MYNQPFVFHWGDLAVVGLKWQSHSHDLVSCGEVCFCNCRNSFSLCSSARTKRVNRDYAFNIYLPLEFMRVGNGAFQGGWGQTLQGVTACWGTCKQRKSFFITTRKWSISFSNSHFSMVRIWKASLTLVTFLESVQGYSLLDFLCSLFCQKSNFVFPFIMVSL